jgi:DNA-binding IclR family transcriptional regulator
MVKSVHNALRALDFIVERHLNGKIVSLGDISSHLELQNTTVRNMLKTMEASGYVSRGEKRSYCLGYRCLDIERSRIGGKRLVDAAARALPVLAERIGESLVLATIIGGRRNVLLRISGGDIISVDSAKADAGSGYGLVTNRIMLAYASQSELDAMIEENGFPTIAEWEGVDSQDNLIVELRRIREMGYAEQRGESLSSVAFPILSENGDALAAVGVYAPTFRYDTAKADYIKKEIKKSIVKIVALL